MKKITLIFFLIMLSNICFAQNIASRRAASLGLGTNFSYFENYWNGTPAKHYGDYIKAIEVTKRKQELSDAASQGIKSVRLPVCFSAWASLNPPYNWEYPQNFAAIDSMISWTLARNMKIIIDLHHPEMDGKFPTALNLERLTWIWEQVANRYKTSDPEKVIFELWNEPHDMTAQAWLNYASPLLKTIRTIAPNHTIIVGASDWNGINALTKFLPFQDSNIIYTFHFYDPFVFTHQGASWAGLQDVKNVPYPSGKSNPAVPASVKGSWIEGAINNYKNDGTNDAILKQILFAKQWSLNNNVPIFCGEFGSYGDFAGEVSRCNHVFACYKALGSVDIPCAFWEWDGGFNLFQRGSTTTLSNCAKEAMALYVSKQKPLSTTNQTEETTYIYPNPVRDTFKINSKEKIDYIVLIDVTGKTVAELKTIENQADISQVPTGFYTVKLFGINQKLIGFQKVIKN